MKGYTTRYYIRVHQQVLYQGTPAATIPGYTCRYYTRVLQTVLYQATPDVLVLWTLFPILQPTLAIKMIHIVQLIPKVTPKDLTPEIGGGGTRRLYLRD